MLTRLDPLVRSTHDLLNILAAIAEKNPGFRSLGDAWGGHDHGVRAVYADRARRPARQPRRSTVAAHTGIRYRRTNFPSLTILLRSHQSRY